MRNKSELVGEIEVGKKYLTRSGKIAHINEFFTKGYPYPYSGKVDMETFSYFADWTETGNANRYERFDPLDLMREITDETN